MSMNEADWKVIVDRRDKLRGVRGTRRGAAAFS
jgi:hypothetical protein